MEFYRTFIGLPVKVSNEVIEARKQLMSYLSTERISWVEPEKYHITLRFIGDTPVATVKKISLALQKRVVVPKKAGIQLSHLSYFGPRNSPRVIWIGFEQNNLFNLLKAQVDDVLVECGIPLSDQLFRAHLTLGLVRSLKNMTGFYDAVSTHKDRFSKLILIDRVI